jgi:hypothetical protein
MSARLDRDAPGMSPEPQYAERSGRRALIGWSGAIAVGAGLWTVPVVIALHLLR